MINENYSQSEDENNESFDENDQEDVNNQDDEADTNPAAFSDDLNNEEFFKFEFKNNTSNTDYLSKETQESNESMRTLKKIITHNQYFNPMSYDASFICNLV